MAGQTENQNTSNSQSSGDGGEKKLYAGKYQTVEELENAYRESEKKFHESNQLSREVLDRLDRLENTRALPREEYSGSDGYGRGEVYDSASADDQRVLTDFYVRPTKVLSEMEERAAAKAEQRIRQQQKQQNEYQARVAAWAQNNQDVASEYGDLLSFYVGQTDARKSPEARLDEAAAKVRQRVAQLHGKGRTSAEPNADEFVDGASGGSRSSGNRAPAGKPVVDAESQLGSYAAERNRSARKPLGLKRD